MTNPREVRPAARGFNASPGVASGAIVLEADVAERLGKAGRRVILVREELGPDDLHGMIHASGLLTAGGDIGSDVAVVARGMGKPYVAGCSDLSIDFNAGRLRLGAAQLSAGDVITVNGSTGDVFVGALDARD